MYEYQNYIIRTTFCPFRTVTKSCPVETVPACPVQIRAHRHIAVYIDSNEYLYLVMIVSEFPFAPYVIKIPFLSVDSKTDSPR